jgi:hypothetical protein
MRHLSDQIFASRMLFNEADHKVGGGKKKNLLDCSKILLDAKGSF